MTQTEPARAVTRLAGGAELPAPGKWQIDPGHTELAFIGRHFMLTKVRGRFTGLSGAIQVTEDPGETTAEVTIDMTSVDSGSPARDEHLRSADFFDTARHPAAAFSGRAAGWQGTRGLLEGELTIRGITRPVTLQAEYLGHAADPRWRPPGRLHRQRHPQPRRLGPYLEPPPGRRRAAGLQGNPHRDRARSGAPATTTQLTIAPPHPDAVRPQPAHSAASGPGPLRSSRLAARRSSWRGADVFLFLRNILPDRIPSTRSPCRDARRRELPGAPGRLAPDPAPGAPSTPTRRPSLTRHSSSRESGATAPSTRNPHDERHVWATAKASLAIRTLSRSYCNSA